MNSATKQKRRPGRGGACTWGVRLAVRREHTAANRHLQTQVAS